MSCNNNNERLAALLQALAQETRLLEEMREVCADPNWIDQPDQRVQRIDSLAQLSTEWSASRAAVERLLPAIAASQGEWPESLQDAMEAKRKSLLAAMEAIRAAEQQTHTSKGALMRFLAQTNQAQEMLGAYRQH